MSDESEGNQEGRRLRYARPRRIPRKKKPLKKDGKGDREE
jgi:hypothetical protein